MAFDVISCQQDIRDANSSKILYYIFDKVSYNYERKYITRQNYEELRDFLLDKMTRISYAERELAKLNHAKFEKFK